MLHPGINLCNRERRRWRHLDLAGGLERGLKPCAQLWVGPDNDALEHYLPPYPFHLPYRTLEPAFDPQPVFEYNSFG
jgi:hypothetical protein